MYEVPSITQDMKLLLTLVLTSFFMRLAPTPPIKVAAPQKQVKREVAIEAKSKPVTPVVAKVEQIPTPAPKPVAVAPTQPTGSHQDWLAQAGISQDQWQCADLLITKESNWRVDADNPTSSAYGIPQSLPGSKMASAGADWQTNPITQLRWMKGYVENRYGNFCGAWQHSQQVNWY